MRDTQAMLYDRRRDLLSHPEMWGSHAMSEIEDTIVMEELRETA